MTMILAAGASRMTLFPTAAALAAAMIAASPAAAQAFLPLSGFGLLPSFAWSEPTLSPGGVKWEGSYARISSGFQVTSSKHFGTSAGPVIGLEAGKMWRDGDFVYGIAGVLEFSPAFGGYANPGFNRATYTRDIAGGFQLKAGVFATPTCCSTPRSGWRRPTTLSAMARRRSPRRSRAPTSRSGRRRGPASSGRSPTSSRSGWKSAWSDRRSAEDVIQGIA